MAWKVKDRILEFLAVRHFDQENKVPFSPVGPGKISVGQSIARTLDVCALLPGGVRTSGIGTSPDVYEPCPAGNPP